METRRDTEVLILRRKYVEILELCKSYLTLALLKLCICYLCINVLVITQKGSADYLALLLFSRLSYDLLFLIPPYTVAQFCSSLPLGSNLNIGGIGSGFYAAIHQSSGYLTIILII